MRLSTYISLGFFLLLPLQIWGDSGRVDSMRRALYDSDVSAAEQADIAFRLAEQFRNHRALDSALHYAQKGLLLSERVGESRRIQYYDQFGQLHFLSKNYLMAIRFFHKGEMLARESGDAVKMAHLRCSLGIAHGAFGAYDQGIEAFRNALTAFQQEGMEKQSLSVQKNLANLYRKMNQGEIAEVLLEKTYEGAKEFGANRLACRTRIMQADHFHGLKQYPKAEVFLADALELAHRYNLIEELDIYLDWAMIHAENGRHDEAMDLMEKAWELSLTVENQRAADKVYGIYGDVYELAGDNGAAIDAYKKAYTTCDSVNDFEQRKHICERLGELHRKMGDFLLADSLAQLAKDIGEQLYEQKRKYRLEELENSAEFDAHLERVEAYQSESSEEQRLRYLWAALIGTFLAGGGWWYYLFRRKKVQHAGIRKQYEQVNVQQQQQMQEKYTQMEEAYTQLEAFISMISHDIKAPLRTILNYLYFISKADDESERLDYLSRIQATTLRINEMVSYVMTLMQMGKSNLPKEKVELEPLLKEIIEDLSSSIDQANGKVITIGEFPTLLGHPADIRHLFLNLISNGLKFARPGIPPLVKISATPSPNGWRIHVQDNGIGMNPDHLAEALKPTRRIHEDSDLYPGTGMGLAVCNEVCKRNGWTLGVDVVDGGGAGFWVETK